MKLTLTLRRRLDVLFGQRADIAEQVKSLDERKRAIDAELLKLTEDAGGVLETEHWRTSLVQTKRTTLSADLLVKHGVKPTIIAKCMVESANKPYVKVSAKADDVAGAVTAKGA